MILMMLTILNASLIVVDIFLTICTVARLGQRRLRSVLHWPHRVFSQFFHIRRG